MLRVAWPSVVREMQVTIVYPFDFYIIEVARASVREDSDVPTGSSVLKSNLCIVAAEKECETQYAANAYGAWVPIEEQLRVRRMRGLGRTRRTEPEDVLYVPKSLASRAFALFSLLPMRGRLTQTLLQVV